MKRNDDVMAGEGQFDLLKLVAILVLFSQLMVFIFFFFSGGKAPSGGTLPSTINNTVAFENDIKGTTSAMANYVNPAKILANPLTCLPGDFCLYGFDVSVAITDLINLMLALLALIIGFFVLMVLGLGLSTYVLVIVFPGFINSIGLGALGSGAAVLLGTINAALTLILMAYLYKLIIELKQGFLG